VELLPFYSGSLFKIAHSMLQCETVPPAQRRAEEPLRSKQATAKFKSGHFGRKQASARSDGGKIALHRAVLGSFIRMR
jgi:hypothetical protein